MSVSTFQYRETPNNFQVKRVIATVETVGLAEGIIDDTISYVSFLSRQIADLKLPASNMIERKNN